MRLAYSVELLRCRRKVDCIVYRDVNTELIESRCNQSRRLTLISRLNEQQACLLSVVVVEYEPRRSEHYVGHLCKTDAYTSNRVIVFVVVQYLPLVNYLQVVVVEQRYVDVGGCEHRVGHVASVLRLMHNQPVVVCQSGWILVH